MNIPKADRLQQVEEYYFSRKLKAVRELRAQGKPVINMAIGNPDMPPNDSVIHSLQVESNKSDAHGYQSYQGIPELAQAMADFYQQIYAVNLDPVSEILPLMGSKEGILHVSLAFLNPNDQVLVPNPGYPTYASVTKLLGATPVFYDLTAKSSWEPDLQKLASKNLSRVKLMWVNYPHMPTGAKGSYALFERLVDFAHAQNIFLVHDNPYSCLGNNSPKSILKVANSKSVAIELNSLSKTFNMAGWRVGMVSGNSSAIQAILQVKSNMDSGMFKAIQKGAIAALQLRTDWYQTMNQLYASRRVLIWQLAKLLGCDFERDVAGMFVWAKLPNNQDAEAFCDKLLQSKNIFIAPGTVFGSNGAGYIRFSLCVSEENIRKAIDRVA